MQVQGVQQVQEAALPGGRRRVPKDAAHLPFPSSLPPALSNLKKAAQHFPFRDKETELKGRSQGKRKAGKTNPWQR